MYLAEKDCNKRNGKVAKTGLEKSIEGIKENANQNFTSSPRGNSTNYFTEEYIEENRDEIDVNICKIGKHCKKIETNFGKIDKNYSTISKNYGIINDNYGIISENFGIIDTNYSIVRKNHKVVGKNFDTIHENHGSIDKNHGTAHKMDRGQIMFDGKYTWPSTILVDIVSSLTDRSYRW